MYRLKAQDHSQGVLIWECPEFPVHSWRTKKTYRVIQGQFILPLRTYLLRQVREAMQYSTMTIPILSRTQDRTMRSTSTFSKTLKSVWPYEINI